jgi:hypothetical protein
MPCSLRPKGKASKISEKLSGAPSTGKKKTKKKKKQEDRLVWEESRRS